VSNKNNVNLLLALILSINAACASSGRHDYSFDTIENGKKKSQQRFLDRADLLGYCTYAFGAKGSDNLITLTISKNEEFIFASSGIWDLAIPRNRPYSLTWMEKNTEYKFLGEVVVTIGRKRVTASRIVASSKEKGSTEFWISDKYGLLGYRPLDTNVQFVSSRLPSASVFSCY
jgi:hypothetical protein